MTRLKTFFAAFILAISLMLVLPVSAQPAHETATQAMEKAVAHGEAEAEGGLPQLNMALFPEQLFWLATCFAALYVLMAFIGLPAVKNTQDKRGQTIGGDLAAAQAANEAAKNMMAEYEKALVDARAKAQATVSEIAAKTAKESAAKQAAQQQELAKHLAQAEAKIAAARDAAVKEVKGSAADLAAAIVEKVTAKSGARHVA